MYKKGVGVTAIGLFGYEITLSTHHPLTADLMRRIVTVQEEVAEVMRYETEEEGVVIESNLPTMMLNLFDIVRQ